GGEQGPANFEALLDGLEAAIVPILERPFAFFGHSMGAIIAHELALRLRRRDRRLPVRLIVSGFFAPHAANAESWEAPAQLSGPAAEHWRLMADWRHVPEEPLPVPVVGLAGLSDPFVVPEDVAEWQTTTSADFILQTLPGDHHSMLSTPSLMDVLAQYLGATA